MWYHEPEPIIKQEQVLFSQSGACINATDKLCVTNVVIFFVSHNRCIYGVMSNRGRYKWKTQTVLYFNKDL